MNRRQFVGQVVLASAVTSVLPRAARAQGGGLRIKFVGLMGYITRSDRSLLVALPGQHPLGHHRHVPFLMARAGSPIAAALGLMPMPGVVAGAFDMELADAHADSFVFRCFDGIDLEVTSGDGSRAVDNRASQLAHMHAIAPGRRLRHNLRRWSSASVTVQGGLLSNSAAHPDAGKVWSFGTYKQQLTDAALYTAAGATVRLSVGADVVDFVASPAETSELWVVSSAGPRTDVPNPKRLDHGQVLFQYFADAEPVIPICEEAQGRLTLPTDLPCNESWASTRGSTARVAPPYTDLCPGGQWCCD